VAHVMDAAKKSDRLLTAAELDALARD